MRCIHAGTACLFLCLLGLQTRLTGATRTVTSLGDYAPGTLRQVIFEAEPGDTIDFAVEGTISLFGEILISKDLIINGPASPSAVTVSAGSVSRVFKCTTGTITISGLTITGGTANFSTPSDPTVGNGGAIYNAANLTLSNCIVSGNTALYRGGAIYNRDAGTEGSTTYSRGVLTLSHTRVSGCTSGGTAGGIWNAGDLNIISSTFTTNYALSYELEQGRYGGGAILNTQSGVLEFKNSTIHGNHTDFHGGGLSNYGSATITSSTFANNTCLRYGGAIYNVGNLDVGSCTIASNTANLGTGGLHSVSVFILSNSIVAGNTSPVMQDLHGTSIGGDYNLVENGGTLAGTHNITGQPGRLAPLSDNGGPTLTMLPLADSQAVNGAAPNYNTDDNPYDQRGEGYARSVNGRVDIGAAESAILRRIPYAVEVVLNGYSYTAFSGQLDASPGADEDTLTYVIVSGTLPPGLSMNPSTGLISGTSGSAVYTSITYKVTDNHGAVSEEVTAQIRITEAPSLVVTSLGDNVDPLDDLTTLREAIAFANSGEAGVDPVVTFAPGVVGTIESLDPSFLITNNLTIQGPGADVITISGGGNAHTSVSLVPIFEVRSGTAKISGLTVSHGLGMGHIRMNLWTYEQGMFDCGGAVFMSGGDLTVEDCNFTDNKARYGSAIYVKDGSLTVKGGKFSDTDLRLTGIGGAIFVQFGTALIDGTTITDNIMAAGGGITVETGHLTARNSTISGNSAKEGFGGGIQVLYGTATIENCTISGNTSSFISATPGISGGGGVDIRFETASVTISNSTITGNSAAYGGGILNKGHLSLYNSIVAGNSLLGGSGKDIYGRTWDGQNTTITGGYNLVEDVHYTTFTAATNVLGVAPLLGPLQNNGGPTLTHAPLPGSPALDAGDPNQDVTITPYDQRGVGYPRVVNGRSCIGAYESEISQTGATFVVNVLDDHDDGVAGVSDCSLREAIRLAPAGSTITFGVSGTITLTRGEIVIGKELSIVGPSDAPGVILSGNNQNRIFSIGSTVSVSHLAFTAGNGVGASSSNNGGAINIDSPRSLTVSNCTFYNNHVTGSSGAIRNAGTLNITNSTFYSNSSGVAGGAIRSGGTMVMTNCTLTNNSCSGVLGGGGIYMGGGVDPL
jgi:CSLREA domain-containing protein